MTQPTRSGFNRRHVLQAGLGLAGGLTLGRPVRAADAPAKVGTFPDGVAGNSVFVGITTPLTGPYSADGHDEQLGYELAIAEINAGSAIAKKWGVSGQGRARQDRPLQDRRLPDQAERRGAGADRASSRDDKAIMITGSVSSATAIALEELAQRNKVLNMVGLSGSNDTTGKNCQRYGFRSQPIRLHGLQGAGAGGGEGARQESEGGLSGAGLHLWPLGVRLLRRILPRRTAGPSPASRSCRSAPRTSAPRC